MSAPDEHGSSRRDEASVLSYPIEGNSTPVCTRCGAPLAAAAGPGGGCLHCLLRGGLEESDDGVGDYEDGAADDVAASAAPEPPDCFGDYELARREDGSPWELGRGSMGITYKALDPTLCCHVALKVIDARVAARPGARERFLREARAAASLSHPNVASVHRFGACADGRGFYAMELVVGETLDARVRRAGPLAPALALEIATQVARALVAAEKCGLVHRDLKPSNLMLVAGETSAGGGGEETAKAGTVKIIDFGLAKVAAEARGEADLTQGGFVGTPHFASPEQFACGEQSIDGRADIYSLGCTLWFLLTGTVPFTGRTLEEIRDCQQAGPPPLAQLADARVPGSLAALLESMLAIDPAARLQSARALERALRRCREEVAAEAASRGRRRSLALAVGAALFLVLALAASLHFLRARVRSAPAPEKSIAVLPFDNLSDDKENAFFADGVQDEVLTNLAKIGELKVISRISVLPYRGGAGAAARPSLREIGRALRVANVLEGSVRRAGNRVRVTVQLIDARTDRHLWAETYDRTIADALSLQGELAREIAAALRATLSPEETVRLADRPTGNTDAYLLFLRARAHETRLLLPTEEDYQSAAQLYEQAIQLDPRFALARARYAAMEAMRYFLHPRAQSPERKAAAQAQADAAYRLQPELGEALLALAYCSHYLERQDERALQQLAAAARRLPNSAEIPEIVGFIHRRQGKWREAVADFQRAEALDPRNAHLLQEGIIVTLGLMRDWPAMLRAYDSCAALLPETEKMRAWIGRAYTEFAACGDTTPLRALLERAPADPKGYLDVVRWDVAMLERDFAAAERALEAVRPQALAELDCPPKEILRTNLKLARGEEPAVVQASLEAGCAALAAEVRASPQSSGRHADLGLLYACTGRKAEAIREGRRAVELTPVSQDATTGPYYQASLALIYTRVGETGQALALLEELLTRPGPVSWYDANPSITLTDLRLRWQWDPLRKDPRFQALLAGPEPRTVY